MTLDRSTHRTFFIDYLRGLMVLYVVLDHAMHAYSPHFKKLHYIADFGGTLLFDIWHMHNDAIMMPLLYFLAGMFVLSSLERRGLSSFVSEKFWRFVVPFILGTALLVPPQKYCSALVKKGLDEPFMDYLWNTYFFQDISSSGFWFLAYLSLLTTLLVLLYFYIPSLIKKLGSFCQFLLDKPVRGFIVFFSIGAVIIGLSEIYWGAQYWIGFWKVFYVRSARFIMKAYLFFLGAGFAYCGTITNKVLLDRLAQSWKTWLLLTIVSGAVYITYSLMNFYTGAYSLETLRHFYNGGTWLNAWPVIHDHGGPILTHATLLTLFMCSLIVLYVALFKRFLDRPLPRWQSLALCSFGIYIFHEPIVVILQYYFYQDDLSEYLKFLVVAVVSLGISWRITHVLRPLPGFRKVL